MKKLIGACIIVLTVFSGFSLFAQESPPFIEELAAQLRERSWSESEIADLVSQSASLSWEQAEGADPELVAYALSYARRQQNEPDLQQPLARANMALELAVAAREMERAGLSRQSAARAAVGGVRDSLSRIREQKEAGNAGSLGEMIRETVRDRVHSEIDGQSRAQERKELIKERKEQAGPPNGGGPPSFAGGSK